MDSQIPDHINVSVGRHRIHTARMRIAGDADLLLRQYLFQLRDGRMIHKDVTRTNFDILFFRLPHKKSRFRGSSSHGLFYENVLSRTDHSPGNVKMCLKGGSHNHSIDRFVFQNIFKILCGSHIRMQTGDILQSIIT